MNGLKIKSVKVFKARQFKKLEARFKNCKKIFNINGV